MKGTMRGICKSKPGVGAEYREDLPIPQITEDEVLIKVHATAICGTDIHLYHWNDYAQKRMTDLPMVFGHETAGEIVEMGNHSELLAKKGAYHGLYMLQFKKDQLLRGV